MDENFWLRQWEAFRSAPVASIIFLAIGAIAAWWFRGKTDKGELRGLEAQRQALQEQTRVLEQRLALAREQEEVAVKNAQKATDEMALLRRSRVARAPAYEIDARIASAESSLIETRRAQDRVMGTLQVGEGARGGVIMAPDEH